MINNLNAMLNALPHRVSGSSMCAESDAVFMCFVYTRFCFFIGEVAVFCVADFGYLRLLVWELEVCDVMAVCAYRLPRHGQFHLVNPQLDMFANSSPLAGLSQ
jgi:hypothetical protein